MDYEKSTNLFETEKIIGYLTIDWTIINFVNMLKTFRNYYFVK